MVVGGDASTGTPPCTAPCTSAQKDKFLLVFLFLLRGGICVIFFAFSSVGKYNPTNFNYSASRSLTQTLRERKKLNLINWLHICISSTDYILYIYIYIQIQIQIHIGGRIWWTFIYTGHIFFKKKKETEGSCRQPALFNSIHIYSSYSIYYLFIYLFTWYISGLSEIYNTSSVHTIISTHL